MVEIIDKNLQKPFACMTFHLIMVKIIIKSRQPKITMLLFYICSVSSLESLRDLHTSFSSLPLSIVQFIAWFTTHSSGLPPANELSS